MSTIDALNELRGDFVRLAEVQDVHRPTNRLRAHRRAAFAAAMLACAALVGTIVVATTGGGAPAARFGIGGPWSPVNPLPRGHRVSLEAAGTALGAPMPLPHDRLANRSLMGPITLATGGHVHGRRDTVVAISYPASHLAVEYETPVPYADPAANYRGYVADNREAGLPRHSAYVGSVAGRPALVIHLRVDSTRTNPASVEFVSGGISIVVVGYQPAPELLRIAGSIAASR
jgi:hypothetical protein